MIFSSFRTTAPSLYKMPIDGTGHPESLWAEELPVFPTSVARDGKTLAFIRIAAASGADIGLLPLVGERKPRMVIATQFNEVTPEISPDGRWLAYATNESGDEQVAIRSMDGLGGRSQISTNGGTEPVWSHDGTSLFYRSGDRMMKVLISTAHGLTAGTPVTLFTRSFATIVDGGIGIIARDYDVSPDDQRFLFVEHDPSQHEDLRRLDLLIRR